MNIFTVTFELFTAFLLIKSINFLKNKNLTDPKLLNGIVSGQNASKCEILLTWC